MTGNKILLDTNIISALLKGDSSIADHIDQAEDTYIPSIVIGELYYGAEYSTQVERNISNIIKLKNRYPVLSVDAGTARVFGIIKAHLRKKGTPIPENDIWIASICQQHQLTLITRDGHFNEIADLDVVKW